MKNILATILGFILVLMVVIAGMMGIVTVYENHRAQQAKERCLEVGMKPVPWGNTYWCR